MTLDPVMAVHSYDELGARLGVSRRRAKQIAREALAHDPETLARFEASDRLSQIARKAARRAREGRSA